MNETWFLTSIKKEVQGVQEYCAEKYIEGGDNRRLAEVR
jgi:hypothetical protein